MIDRAVPVSYVGATASVHDGAAASSLGIGTTHRSTVALPDQAAALVAALGPLPTNLVATARLEAAALGFVREARALAIGAIDRSFAEIDRLVADAVRQGEQTAAALPAISFDDSDRATVALSTAARIIADTPALPLVPSTFAGDR